MVQVKALVVLEVMWGDPTAVAPNFFKINPDNFSGKRLHQLLGTSSFYVTNACRERVGSAKERGTPDPQRLASNLARPGLQYSVLIVCGKVAKKTFELCGFRPKCPVLFIKHPAARDWTRTELAEERERIQECLQ